MLNWTVLKLPRRERIQGRRSRRGLSLLDASLALVVLSAVSVQAARFISERTFERAALYDARFLTELAQAGRTTLMSQTLTVGAGETRVFTPEEMVTQGWLTSGRVSASQSKRSYSVALIGRTADEVLIMARGERSTDRPYREDIPVSAAGVGLVGVVRESREDRVQGQAFDFDISWMVDGLTPLRPQPGDLVVVDSLRRDQSILPYLHRVPMADARLNRMETALDMGGNDIVGAGAVNARRVVVEETLTAGALTATTTTIFGDVNLSSLGVSGNAEMAGDTVVDGGIEATSANVSGQVRASQMTAETLTVVSTLGADELVVETGLEAEVIGATTGVMDELTVDEATVGRVSAEVITANSATVTDRGEFETLTTGGCTGC